MSHFRTLGWCLVACCGFAVEGQDAPVNPDTYESFFCQVSRLTPASPLLENALGTTTEEAQSLSRIANDSETKSVAFTEEIASVNFCVAFGGTPLAAVKVIG